MNHFRSIGFKVLAAGRFGDSISAKSFRFTFWIILTTLTVFLYVYLQILLYQMIFEVFQVVYRSYSY